VLSFNDMIHTKNINIFDCVAQAIIHQANCQTTMGSGIAKQIREKYPEAYEVDCKTVRGDITKLGSFSWVKARDGKHIYNCYSQFRYGKEQRHTDYEAVYTGLSRIEEHAKSMNLTSLALPYKMGCALGGGSWRIVNAIIEDIFEENQIDLYICRYEP
jgi:O-acetyl-ADP-ribose deacetylase (regulator of RNase III)